MVINCNDDEMILIGDNQLEVRINEKACKEISDRYHEYFEDNDYIEESDHVDEATVMKDIYNIVKKYIDKHPLGVTIGGEYVENSDNAQIDAVELFADIMEYYTGLEM